MADEIFNQADINKDQRLDFNEFRNLLAQNLGFGGAIFANNVADGGQYSTGSYESGSTSGTYGDLNANAAGYGGNVAITTNITGAHNAAGGNASYSSYEQSSYSSSAGGGVAGGFDATATTEADATNAVAEASSSSTFEATSSQQQIQQYATSAQGLFQDPNPQIIRRPAQTGQITYTQNVKIRFLQPPPIPPPGPLIIKEVRPPQPPPPPPLVVRQRAPPLPTPPPLILRERPPPIPTAVGAQTVIRKLPALPVPPRSVIIERLPPLPPKPRDIIIERWIPYGSMSHRKTIVQRAEAAKPYPKPRNIIIQYEAPLVRVVRQFQRLGVAAENPQEYTQRYGASLIDTQTLLQQARAAGVIEDISPPGNFTATGSSSSFNAEFANTTSGVETTVAGGADGAASSSSFESSNFGGQQGAAAFSGYESGHGGSTGDLGSGYESASFSTQGVSTFGDVGTSGGYQTYNVSNDSNMDLTSIAFKNADLNKDGTLDVNEFRQFINVRPQ
ncbi:unnamed protein product [Rotaria magnacalcarata]|uniref:EF-hand domain-containing protein n=13 Tax=Rotaria magnacalcarata TaxID=392030 RepID=A0A817A2E8_9BILA|nr:unnamed protein product [Rotaria magnacalcarata]CAF1640416.1 unnamed protein product [Rotaria magnacalcarata]CAF2011642.1 unnamed protein product [Rotaria magnacalcarata]CAF2118934.1 unnamed protein product [Rotaria magnacalcarata]CAF2237410.1 unnamed protein product [Rotaria magnacalcarata]